MKLGQKLWDEWRDRAVVKRDTARNRLRKGWSVEAAFLTHKLQHVADLLPDLVACLSQHGPLCLDDLAQHFPHVSRSVIGRILRDAVTRSRLSVELHRRGTGRGAGTVKRYSLAARRPQDVAPIAQTGGPAWVHPIRARALGLPVASVVRDAPAMDYAHPRKVAA